MSTYKEKLDYTEETKNLIKTAITNKGVAVGEGDTFRSYAEKIDSIPAARPAGPIRIVTSGTWKPGYDTNFANSIESIDWSDFNKAGVTSMWSMFQYWKGKTLDIANLSTKGVTSMFYMFYDCNNLTSLDVSNFDTSQVENMESMFYNCDNLTSLDVSNFNTNKVTDIAEMFSGCEKLTDLNLSSFNTVNITTTDTDWGGFIKGCPNLENVIWGNNWMPNPAVTLLNYAGLSYKANAKLSHDTILDLFNKLATRNNTPELRLCTAVYDRMTADEIAIATNKGWNVVKAAF